MEGCRPAHTDTARGGDRPAEYRDGGDESALFLIEDAAGRAAARGDLYRVRARLGCVAAGSEEGEISCGTNRGREPSGQGGCRREE